MLSMLVRPVVASIPIVKETVLNDLEKAKKRPKKDEQENKILFV